MNLTTVDWIIAASCILLVTVSGYICSRLIKGVADFIVAGRNVRKYLALGTQMAEGLGLISIAAASQEGFIRGFSYLWSSQIPLIITTVVFGIFGFAIMRYRQLKLMTIPQFYELRYSKGIRLTTAFVLAISGILNLAIFPIIGCHFLMHFIGLPKTFAFMGLNLPTIEIVMLIMIGLALFFTYMGGMVTVVFTDFIQFILITIVIFATSIVIVYKVGIPQIHDTLMGMGPKAFNPFSSASYGWAWMLYTIIAPIPAFVSFAPTMQKIASVDNEKTARTITLLGNIIGNGRTVLIVLWGVAALAIMGPDKTSDFASQEQYERFATAIFLGRHMPIIIKGFALAGMVAAFVSTVDSYLLSWSSIITNDIVCMLSRKPLSRKAHIWVLRISIAAIAAFIYMFGVIYKPSESILSYITVTGSMFVGVGVILIGGLYWKRATTLAAYVAVLVCCTVPLIDLIAKQVMQANYPLTGPESSLIGLSASIVLFVLISLFTKRTDKALKKEIL